MGQRGQHNLVERFVQAGFQDFAVRMLRPIGQVLQGDFAGEVAVELQADGQGVFAEALLKAVGKPAPDETFDAAPEADL